MESWDDDNFEPTTVRTTPAFANKWEGEDEEDEVKENWEDEDDEKKEDIKSETDVKKPQKKTLAEKIAEKEKIKRELMEKRLKEQEEEEISAEEQLRRQQESDLKIALETTFGDPKVESSSLEELGLPETKEEFESFTETLTKKLTILAKNPEYTNFVENLSRNLCASMSSLDIKKIKNSLDNLYLEKQKIEKGEKTKKSKGKGKAKLKLEGDNELSQLSAYVNDYDDYDDFM